MKTMRMLLSVRKTLLVALLITLVGGNLLLPAAHASSTKKEYTYTVRIFAGAKGTISGDTVKVYDNLSYGDTVRFSQGEVTLTDSNKYYVRGIRESGKDNNTASLSAIKVTQDMDYVVAYGIKGNSVAYTVNYQDASGNTLAPSETYYGNVGDMPVVAYLYVDGYFPQARNLTRTLKENASQNVFTFVYQRIETETPTTTAAQPTQGDNNGATAAAQPTASPNTNNNAENGGENTPAENSGGDTNANAGQPEGQVANEPAAQQPTAPAQQPAQQPTLPPTQDDVPDLINLDDNSVPLADFPGGTAAGTEGGTVTETTEAQTPVETADIPETPTPGAGGFFSAPRNIVFAVGAVLLLLLAGFFLLRRRK